MDNTEQRAYVKTRFQLGDAPANIYRQLLATLGTRSVTCRTVETWCKAIREGRFASQKRPPPGRPLATSSSRNVRRVKRSLTANPRMSIREIANELSLSYSTVQRILTTHLDYRNVFSQWVPHELSEQNKKDRVRCSRDLLALFKEHPIPHIASHYLVQDESWVLWDQQERRRVWIPKNARKPATPRVKLTKRKTMILIAFSCKPKRFSLTLLPQGATVDSSFTVKFLKATRNRFRQLKTAPVRFKNMMLQWDNARPHVSRETTDYLDQTGIRQIKQSPYSPDLNMCDRFLFRKIKSGLKKCALKGPEDVEREVRRLMNLIPETELLKELEKLSRHAQEVIRLGGIYPTDI